MNVSGKPRDNGSLSQTGGGDWWLDSKYILKIEKTKFSGTLTFIDSVVYCSWLPPQLGSKSLK